MYLGVSFAGCDSETQFGCGTDQGLWGLALQVSQAEEICKRKL